MKQNEFNDLADELEAACGDWENSDGLSEKALNDLIAKVEAMDAKTKEPKCPERKKRRLKKRYVLVLAAALALAMGTGVVGDRVWRSDSRDLERVSEVTTKVDNENKADILLEEEQVYQEIAEKLGIAILWLGYVPDGMELYNYVIMENAGWAYVNYFYNENFITIQMAKRTEESSSNVQWDGDSRRLENVSNVYGCDEIEAYCVDEEHQNYGANVLYGNGYYNIAGFFESEEQFKQILEEIYFKNL